jgi:hypothetical protein
MVEKIAEAREGFECRGDASAMFFQHGLLGCGVAAEHGADQETVMLIQRLQCHRGGTMQFRQPLLTAATQ